MMWKILTYSQERPVKRVKLGAGAEEFRPQKKKGKAEK